MKIWRWGYIGFLFALSACTSGQPIEQTTQPNPADVGSTASATDAEEETAACAPVDSQVPLQPATETELPFERLDFRPVEVEATETTLAFVGKRYKFIFCQRDRTWGVESITPEPAEESDYAEYFAALAEPDYEIVTGQDRVYQARVRLDAAWLDEQTTATDEDLEQIIFELIKPGETEPISQVLYTNTDIRDRELGATAGIPTLTQTVITDEALWWSIGFEQGEGASGIATVVQYQIEQDKLVLWQPSDLGNAQITDLALTTADDKTTLWLGTQYSGEGNPYLPAEGLVAYHLADNTLQTYTGENSPLIGAIPTRLWANDDTLWTATASGVCAIDWAAIENSDSWECWRFTAMANVPADRELYPSLLSETSIDRLDGVDPVELLWIADTDINTPEAPVRYEIQYESGLTAQLDQGADYYVGPEDSPENGYFWWPGDNWSWNGIRFVRPWDQVAVNYVGGGPQGIDPGVYESYVADWKTMRGEFELLALNSNTTEIKYYSAWIDGEDIEPWVTVTESVNAPLDDTDPTDAVLAALKQAAQRP